MLQSHTILILYVVCATKALLYIILHSNIVRSCVFFMSSINTWYEWQRDMQKKIILHTYLNILWNIIAHTNANWQQNIHFCEKKRKHTKNGFAFFGCFVFKWCSRIFPCHLLFTNGLIILFVYRMVVLAIEWKCAHCLNIYECKQYTTATHAPQIEISTNLWLSVA